MKNTLALALLTVSLAIPAVSAEAPAVDAKALFESKCSLCHGTDRPLGKTKDLAGWESTVKRMQDKSAGSITTDEAKAITNYLATIRGQK